MMMRHGMNAHYSFNQKDNPKRVLKRNENIPYYFFTITLSIIGFISGNAVSYELNNKNLLTLNGFITK